MKLNSYASNMVSTQALKTEIPLGEVFISANKALSLDRTVKMSTWLTTEATGRTLKHTHQETYVIALPIQCHLPWTLVNSGESEREMRFQLAPVAGIDFPTKSSDSAFKILMEKKAR